jgi:hypothetical protein
MRACLSDRPHGDVAVGDHADQAIVFGDRRGPDIHVTHHGSGLADRLVGMRRWTVPLITSPTRTAVSCFSM